MRESRPDRPGDEALSAPQAPAPAAPDELAELRPADILEAITDPCCILEIDGYQGRVVWISAALSESTGYVRGDTGPVGDLLTTTEPAADAGRLAGLREMPRKDGSTFPASVTWRPLRMDGPGRPGWWLVTIRDSTEALASEALLEERSATEERARRGLSLVARVSDILADVGSTSALGDIAALLVRRVVPWAAFYGYGNRLEQIVGLEGIAQYGRQLPSPARREPVPGDVVGQLFREPRMQRAVIDRSRAVPPHTLTAELADLIADDPDAPDEGPLWLLPVLGGQGVLGFLAAQPGRSGVGDTREMPAAELVTVLELVARRVGMAMDNLQLYAHEHQLAETLQRSMLPEQDVVDGVDVWSYYAASSEHAQVGGDWYDVLDLGQGRIGVVVGDVVGHDVEAAAAMGQLRSVTRAYAAEFIDPATVLGKVDRLVAGMRLARPASFVYATLQPAGDHWRLTYSRAGHLPVVHVREGRAGALEGANGPLIGFGGAPRESATTTLRPGDVVVLYTDGLIERRDRSMREGLDALMTAVARIDAPDAAGIGEELLQELGDAPEDDVAVVVVRIPDPRSTPLHDWSGPRQRRWQMPTDPSTIARSRQALLRACEAWGIEDTAAAELVVSELVANAVMHGWGRIDLRLSATGDGLRVEVEDSNPSPPVVREGRTSRVGGYGLHIVSRLAEWGWRPTPAGKVVWARVRDKKPWSSSAD